MLKSQRSVSPSVSECCCRTRRMDVLSSLSYFVFLGRRVPFVRLVGEICMHSGGTTFEYVVVIVQWLLGTHEAVYTETQTFICGVFFEDRLARHAHRE